MRPSVVSSSIVPPAPAVTARSTASAAADDTSAAMICPPSKASSMRIESSARRDHLREDAVDGIRVHERDFEAEQSAARPLVDQLDACPFEAPELRGDILDLVGDVVHPGAAVGEEPTDRRVASRGRQKLDPTSSEEHGRRLDALVADLVAVLERRAEQAPVG